MGESKHTPRWFSRGIDLIEVAPEAPPYTTPDAVAPSHVNCIAVFDTADQATLAGAAPLMLEALRRTVDDCGCHADLGVWCGPCSQARAAIKAATGGET